MTEEQKVQELEDKGRNIFKTYCNEQPWCKFVKESKGRWTGWDVAILDNGTPTVVEIKYREHASDKFPTWYLEVDKLKGLKALQDKCREQTRIVYCNIFTNNLIAMWNLDTCPLGNTGVAQVQTNQYGDTSKKYKTVYGLFLMDAYRRDPIVPFIQTRNDNEDDGLPF